MESGEEEAPKLVKTEKTEQPDFKGKNKRAVEEFEEEPATLDYIMTRSLKPAESAVVEVTEPKLSNTQLKKLKDKVGKAVEAAIVIRT